MSELMFWNLFEDVYSNDNRWKIFAKFYATTMKKCNYQFGICINEDGSVRN